MDDSAITCDEIIDMDVEAKSNDEAKPNNEKTNFNEKKAACKTQNFYILLTFLLITIALLIAVSSCHDRNNKLRESCINKCIIKMSNKVKDKKPHILLFQ